MRYEMTLDVEVEGDYVAGSSARPIGDGTWEPGEGGTMRNTRVIWNGVDVTACLDAEQLECAEEAWLENYES